MMSSSYRKSLLPLLAVSFATMSCAQDAPKAPPPRYETLPPKVLPTFLNGTVLQRMDHLNPEPLQVSSFGLVVNLPGTGDSTAPNAVRKYILNELSRRGFGSNADPDYQNVTPERVLDDPRRRTAIVRVDGFMPPGTRKGQTFDVIVTALEGSGVTSLAGGHLYQCDLKFGGADPRNPNGPIAIDAKAEGAVFLNPGVSLNPRTSATSRNISRFSRRQGLILDGGVAKTDQPLVLRLRTPQRALIRQIDERIGQHFQDPSVAEAKDEAILHLRVPESYKGDWERFLGVVNHLYLDGTPEVLVTRAKLLADEAVKPDAPLENISYAWEAMGPVAIPAIQPLMSPKYPEDVQFAAARAAAFIGDPSAQTALIRIAKSEGHRFQIDAVRTIGGLKSSPSVNGHLRTLLNASSPLVRIEAYKVLAANRSADILSIVLPKPREDERFILDIVRSDQPPIIYASRSGIPRIALIGQPAQLNLPVTFTALDDRLSISSDPRQPGVTVFHRREGAVRPVQLQSRTDLDELIGWLGGAGRDPSTKIDLTYGEVVAIVQSLAEQKLLSAQENNQLAVNFVLQETAGIENEIADAPQIIPRSRQQTDEAPPVPTTRPVSAAPEAKKGRAASADNR